MIFPQLEPLFIRVPHGLMSRIRMWFFKRLGLKAGTRNRLERIRCRRLSKITIGEYNAFTEGCCLWPADADFGGVRIRIGNRNYFNRGVMIDACGSVEIGNDNMFGPDIYFTDSNHRFGVGLLPHEQPMDVGHVKIGNGCWIGAHAVILKDVELGDYCVVGAGAVVTKSFPAGSVIAGIPAEILQPQRRSFSGRLVTSR
jgi:acetyltransferase-like isoleucine patch superfamily enzyme